MKKRLHLRTSIKQKIALFLTVILIILGGIVIAYRFRIIKDDDRFKTQNYYEESQKKTEMQQTNQSK